MIRPLSFHSAEAATESLETCRSVITLMLAEGRGRPGGQPVVGQFDWHTEQPGVSSVVLATIDLGFGELEILVSLVATKPQTYVMNPPAGHVFGAVMLVVAGSCVYNRVGATELRGPESRPLILSGGERHELIVKKLSYLLVARTQRAR